MDACPTYIQRTTSTLGIVKAAASCPPMSQYQREILRFMALDSPDVTKLTPLTYSLIEDLRFYDGKCHDMSNDIDKGYISFFDEINSR